MRNRRYPDRPARPAGGGRFGPWSWEARFFERGELPLALLCLIQDGPRHGYELMKFLEERSGGLYSANAGSIYPALQQLQDDGLVTSQEAEGGKRSYNLTDSGRAKLEDEAEAAKAIWKRAEDDEWMGWDCAMKQEAAEVIRPAFRLMRTALKSVARTRDAERADNVREILTKARMEIHGLD